MIQARTRSDCAKCPLNQRNRVWGQGTPGRLILLGEAPGAEENLKGEPFVGSAGRYLNWGLFQAGIRRTAVWTTNTIACRPPDNNYWAPEARAAQVNCRPGFEDEIAMLKARGAKVILAFGNNALSYLGIPDQISKARGSVYEWNGLWVVPTYHPSYLNRMISRKGDDTTGSLKYIWIADMKKAARIADTNWQPPVEHFITHPKLDEVAAYAEARIESHDLVAVDIETFGKELAVVGLAHTPNHALCVPFLGQKGVQYWTDKQELEVRQILQRLFDNCPLILQNALFDIPHLRSYGFSIPWERVQHDTMLLHHAVSPELPHDLGFIVSLYGETPYWKSTLLSNLGFSKNIPDLDFRTYNLRDCVVLHQVLPGLLNDLKETGSEEVYRNESMALLKPVGKMSQNGFSLDQGKLDKFIEGKKEELKKLDTELRTMVGLPDGFSLTADQDLRWFLYNETPSKFKKLADLPKKKRKDTKVYRELVQLQEVAERVKPLWLPTGYRGRKTKGGGATSVDEQGRLSLQVAAQNRLAQLGELVKVTEAHKAEGDAIRKLLGWLETFQKFTEVDKIITTYATFPTGLDGRVRASFLIHGTATGRLSSRSPNLQNLPKEELGIRKAFVVPKGKVLLSADYSNLEVWVGGLEWNDDVLLDTLRKGINVHDANTKTLFEIDENHKLWKLGRAAAKIFQFGGLSYGGGDREIYEKVILKAPKLNLTFAAFQEAKERWITAHPKYREWRDRIEQQVRTEHFTQTFMGRRRWLMDPEHDAIKQGLNTPIQGGAAHIINRALIRIDNLLEKLYPDVLLLVQVHDELDFEVPETLLAPVAQIIYDEMTRPVNFPPHGNVRFQIEMSVGGSWGDLKPLDLKGLGVHDRGLEG